MPAGHWGPRPRRVLVALAAVGCVAGSTLLRPSGATYVREGVNQGPLEPADSAGPTNDELLGACAS